MAVRWASGRSKSLSSLILCHLSQDFWVQAARMELLQCTYLAISWSRVVFGRVKFVATPSLADLYALFGCRVLDLTFSCLSMPRDLRFHCVPKAVTIALSWRKETWYLFQKRLLLLLTLLQNNGSSLLFPHQAYALPKRRFWGSRLSCFLSQ